jgi:hypothetical protein
VSCTQPHALSAYLNVCSPAGHLAHILLHDDVANLRFESHTQHAIRFSFIDRETENEIIWAEMHVHARHNP